MVAESTTIVRTTKKLTSDMLTWTIGVVAKLLQAVLCDYLCQQLNDLLRGAGSDISKGGDYDDQGDGLGANDLIYGGSGNHTMSGSIRDIHGTVNPSAKV